MISLHNVSKSFVTGGTRHQAVEPVSLHIEEGSVHGIIGISGAGKSTLLRMINVLERPDSGQVMVNGQDLTLLGERQLREARRAIGMIFQQFQLVSNRTVLGNVAMPLELARMPKAERMKRAAEVLKYVGLEDKAKHYPSQLSGGQKQRVAIARALANYPKVLLCDEPTSSLDPRTTADILSVLQDINLQLGVTIVIVSHEMDVVNRICDHISVMESGRLVTTYPVVKEGDPT
ncbi:ATP-binding cassette domain-containing protein [Paenibacillus campinasensis]|uniref:ATP-binding cassette domain-containing protein n=1 Tax=Paenibacillus campinasensis TaxID=66347 RepID=A0ABW9T3S0_9BACL|nr:methionine ABC transporter ATP-binding protein [Paenibacillus campinasensis]MUG67950.1 ATP-binding cassette domain-containing protein [Paenibacillus campinasensis]